MKSKLTLGLGLVALPLALQARSSLEETYLEFYHARDGEPVPTAVATPVVDAEFNGQEITLKFVVDPAGHPKHIKSATPGADPRLVASVAKAVLWWKFNPAYRNGKPVSRRVELPVAIVAQ